MRQRSKIRVLIVFMALFIVVCGVTLSALMPVKLPETDNNTPICEKIKHFYPDRMLESVLDIVPVKKYGSKYEYQSLDELKYLFTFECARDPSVYSDDYNPYVVLMAKSGKKLFLFYDPDTMKIVARTVIEDFLSVDEAEAIINEAAENGKPFSEFGETFWKYSTGIDSAAKCSYFLIEVKEGVLVLSTWNREEVVIRSKEFYTNEQLLGENPVDLSKKPFTIWPILPIDKVAAEIE